jgi:hypothetical protein
MARATWALAASTAVFAASTAWLWRENRDLRAAHPVVATAAPVATGEAPAPAAAGDPWVAPARPATKAAAAPALPAPKEESRLERRQRRQQEFAAMFGRGDGETEDEYRARIVPLIKAGLAVPRARVEDMRKEAEAKAHVTPEQSQKLDRAFDKIYADVLDYTNKAIADGQLSPYERNVAGWLELAGGYGAILQDAQGQIGQVLSPEQVRAMQDSGFEWAEYLGLEVPWEKLTPPPPKPH